MQEGEIEALGLTGEPESDIKLLIQEAAQILAEARAKASTDTQIRALTAAGGLIEKAAKIFGTITDQTIEVKLLNVIVTDADRDQGSQVDTEPVQLLLEPGED